MLLILDHAQHSKIQSAVMKNSFHASACSPCGAFMMTKLECIIRWWKNVILWLLWLLWLLRLLLLMTFSFATNNGWVGSVSENKSQIFDCCH
ncbi:hypothetical protein BC829DRAFT_391697 [Chytridium lagenaria]|nr:hypothetical protein BC829DRAFT_391697 [Chytridium lagenaria]